MVLSVGHCMYMYEYLGQSDWPEILSDHKFSKSEEKRSLIKTKTDAYFEQFSNVFAGMNSCYNAFLLFTCTYTAKTKRLL